MAGIDCTPGYEHIEFGNTQEVALGKAIGDIDENVVKKAQIRRTIEAHLDKELRYMGRGIKVLSLFFIDKVEKYRHWSRISAPLAASNSTSKENATTASS